MIPGLRSARARPAVTATMVSSISAQALPPPAPGSTSAWPCSCAAEREQVGVAEPRARSPPSRSRPRERPRAVTGRDVDEQVRDEQVAALDAVRSSVDQARAARRTSPSPGPASPRGTGVQADPERAARARAGSPASRCAWWARSMARDVVVVAAEHVGRPAPAASRSATARNGRPGRQRPARRGRPATPSARRGHGPAAARRRRRPRRVRRYPAGASDAMPGRTPGSPRRSPRGPPASRGRR